MIAIACNAPIGRDGDLAGLDLNRIEGIAESVSQRLLPGRASARGLRI